MEDQVDKDVIKDRFDRLCLIKRDICKELQEESRRYRESSDRRREYARRRNVNRKIENNLLVHFKGCKEQIGTMADVKLVEEKGFYYMGEQIHG